MITKRAARFLLGLTLASACFAQVKFTRETDVIHIDIAGKPLGDYHYGTDVAKPYIAPLRAASGTMVTRQFPMVEGLGETTDHRHHRGLWFGYIDVNGVNFWENEYSYKNPKSGNIVSKSIDEVKGGKTGTLKTTSEWVDPSKKTILVENQTMLFRGDNTLREIDVDITLTAKEKCVFGDDKDGIYGIRLADPLIEKKPGTGTMVSSAGLKTMKEIWGKQADWVDYSGEINGEKVGVAIFDHPTSFRHPTRWHVRTYGLFAANPFGNKDWKSTDQGDATIKKGDTMRLHYRVLFYEGTRTPEQLDAIYKEYGGK
jgi:hypothetical protein